MSVQHLTHDEQERLYYLAGRTGVARILGELADAPDPEDIEAEFEAKYETVEEQSEFRRTAIETILKLCDEPGTKRQLVAAIKRLVEESFVEL